MAYRKQAPLPLSATTAAIDEDYDYKAATSPTSPAASGGNSPSNNKTTTSPLSPSSQQPSQPSVDGDEALMDLVQLEELHVEAEKMKALGNKHMAAQEYTRAYNAYSAALQLSPVGPSSHVFLSNRAAALLSLKRYNAAATDARRAVALAPTFGKAHARLGQALYFLKDYGGAVDAYEDAIQYEPDNQVTKTYLEKARSKLERNKARATVGGSPHGEDISLESASTAHYYSPSVATDPNLGAGVVRSNYRGDLAPLAAAAAAKSPNSATAIGNAGNNNVSMGSNTFNNTRNQSDDPDFEEALRIQQRANHYLSNKEYKAAIEEYTAALFLVPNDPVLSPDLHLGRAHALNGSRRHERARNDAMLAVKLSPSPAAYSTLAKSLFYMKEYRQSIDTFHKCMEHLPPGEALGMFDKAYLQKAESALEEEEASLREAGLVTSTSKSASPIPKLPPPRFVPREEAIQSTPNLPPMPKEWPQQTPLSPSSFRCGPERNVVFLSEALGVKLNRGSDGIVRVLWIQPESPGSDISRQGEMNVGDVVREVGGVDIRRPITNIMWGDTVALVKMAPRPITFVVSPELSETPAVVVEEIRKANEETDVALRPSPAIEEDPVRDAMNSTTITQQEVSPPVGGGSSSIADIAADTSASIATAGTELEPPPAAEERVAVGKMSSENVVEEAASDDRGADLETAEEAVATPQQPGTIEQASDEKEPDIADAQNTEIASSEQLKDAQDEVVGVGTEGEAESSNKLTEGTTVEGVPNKSLLDEDDVDESEPIVSEGATSSEQVKDTQDEVVGVGIEGEAESSNKLTEGTTVEGVPNKSLLDEDDVDESEPIVSEGATSSEQVKDTQDEVVGVGTEGETESSNKLTEGTTVEGVPNKSLLDHDDVDESEPIVSEGAATLPNEEERMIGGEVLFERNSPPNYCGWDNLQWLSYSGVRKVRCCQPCFRLLESEKKQVFWTSKNISYSPRVLAIYNEPNLILVLRRPSSPDEVHTLLGLPAIAELDDAENAVDNYLIVESVIEPSLCKLRLSPLTTPTSLAPAGADERRLSCFELITPSESILLSSVSIRSSVKRNEKSFSDSGAFLETSATETALASTISGSHDLAKDIGEQGVSIAWNHNLILGSLFNLVVSGDGKALDEALQQSKDRVKVDEEDDNGLSALYYACIRRNAHAANSLVAAGAATNVDVQMGNRKHTLAHICALNLDEKTLGIVLSATTPSRPDPNALDSPGQRTPMYLAATEGRTASGETDPLALSRCIEALEAWGGSMMVPDPLKGEINPLQHPISILAGYWFPEELTVVLDHTSFALAETTMSLSAQFQFPMHRALVSLQTYDFSVDANEMAPENRLVRTLRVLLEHSFEPNERTEPQSRDSFWSSEWSGFTPIQILASIALGFEGKKEDFDEGLYNRIRTIIEDTAEFLVRNGARLTVDPPPTKRLRQLDSASSAASSGESDSNKKSSEGRSKVLRSASKQDVFQALGGSDRLKKAEREWNELGPVAATANTDLYKEEKASFSETDVPGGSSEKSCAICWKEFGPIRNRKHKCRLTRRFVCDACSGKRITDNDGVEYRVSDGQFLLARVDAAKEENSKAVAKQDLIRAQEAAKASSEAETKNEGNRFSFFKIGSGEEEEETAPAKSGSKVAESGTRAAKVDAENERNRESLLGNMLDRATKMIGGEEEEESAPANSASKVAGLASSLNETRNALLQRGEKLSDIGDKSAQLVDASSDFARMAKELRQKTESRGVFW